MSCLITQDFFLTKSFIMKIKALFLMPFLLFVLAVSTLSAEDLKEQMKGTWKAQIAEAPHGYQNFKIKFYEAGPAYLVDIDGESLVLKGQTISVKTNQLSTNVNVGENVAISIWMDNNEAKGMAESSTRKFPIVLKRLDSKK